MGSRLPFLGVATCAREDSIDVRWLVAFCIERASHNAATADEKAFAIAIERWLAGRGLTSERSGDENRESRLVAASTRSANAVRSGRWSDERQVSGSLGE